MNVYFLQSEILWIVSYFKVLQPIGLVFWMFSILTVYRGALYVFGANMRTFLKVVFALFIAFYLVSIYGVSPFLIPVLIVIGFMLFPRNYPLKSV